MPLPPLNKTISWVFWGWFFDQHNEEFVSKHFGDYRWPQPLEKYKEMLNGGQCRVCHDKGYKNLDPSISIDGLDIKHVYCVCTMLAEMEEAYSIEARYKEMSLNGFQNRGNTIKEVVPAVKGFIKRPTQWLYLVGGFGSGKTHMLEAAKTSFKGLALYLTMSKLNDLVFEYVGKRELGWLIETISSVPILCLDDFGSGFDNAFLYSSLYAIVNNRYITPKETPIFFTSNDPWFSYLNSSDKNLQRVADRLCDTAIVQHVASTQKSFRGERR